MRPSRDNVGDHACQMGRDVQRLKLTINEIKQMKHTHLSKGAHHYKMTVARFAEEIIRINEGDVHAYGYKRKIRKQRIPAQLYSQAKSYIERKSKQLASVFDYQSP